MRVANYGKHLVTEQDCMNLIPTDFSDDLVLLYVLARWKKNS